MSFDIVAQRFIDGDAAEADAPLLQAILAPYLGRTEPDADFCELTFADGTADLYGIDDLAQGFMVNHVSGRLAWDLLAELVTGGGLTLMPMDAPPLIAAEEQRTHLPEGFGDEAVVITSGADILREIEQA